MYIKIARNDARNIQRFPTDEQLLTLAALTCNWLLKPVNVRPLRGVQEKSSVR